ncbi:MAG: hypothetical protein HF975_16805 [ANME-2 cluster archaeon]|nr:hypothetical protein [ANME-2 cluster archaeon]MBC2748623.1 hypothetical protein [ANME-2 cluster archaeon]
MKEPKGTFMLNNSNACMEVAAAMTGILEFPESMQSMKYDLCIIGMIFYRYLAWKCKYLRLSLRQLVEELEGIRVALLQGKTGGKVDLVVEEMDAKQARLFSLLDLGKFMGK